MGILWTALENAGASTLLSTDLVFRMLGEGGSNGVAVEQQAQPGPRAMQKRSSQAIAGHLQRFHDFSIGPLAQNRPTAGPSRRFFASRCGPLPPSATIIGLTSLPRPVWPRKSPRGFPGHAPLASCLDPGAHSPSQAPESDWRLAQPCRFAVFFPLWRMASRVLLLLALRP